MKKILAAAAAVSLLAIAAPASAGIYGSLGYGQFMSEDTDFDVINGRIGWGDDAKWLGFEAEFAASLNAETDAGPPVVKTRISSDISAYAVAHFDVSEQFTLFARAGYGVLRVQNKTPGIAPAVNPTTVDFSADGFAGGVGAQFNLDDKNAFRADYTYRDFETDLNTHLDVWSISWVRKFK